MLKTLRIYSKAISTKLIKSSSKKFDDRKDKDIDNDGDVDSSDKYLHKRRKAIGQVMKDEGNVPSVTNAGKEKWRQRVCSCR